VNRPTKIPALRSAIGGRLSFPKMPSGMGFAGHPQTFPALHPAYATPVSSNRNPAEQNRLARHSFPAYVVPRGKWFRVNVVLDRLIEPAADDIRVRRAESQAEVLRGFCRDALRGQVVGSAATGRGPDRGELWPEHMCTNCPASAPLVGHDNPSLQSQKHKQHNRN
jgi:hypothetical protein